MAPAEEAAAGAAGGVRSRDGAMRGVESAGGGVGRLLERVRREFSGLPVYVGVEDGYIYVKRTAPMDQKQFKRYIEACRRLALDSTGGRRGGSSSWRS